jgi:hypothetical protein
MQRGDCGPHGLAASLGKGSSTMADAYHQFWDASKECQSCGRTFHRRDKPGVSYRRFTEDTKFCSKRCAYAAFAGDRDARFWANVAKSGPNECWEWQGSIDPGGYGVHWFAGSYIRAHRLTMEIDGRSIEPGQFALHSCDNRRCVNPAHLRAGSHADNARDRVVRGRSRHNIGQDNHSAKLTDAAVRIIRSSQLSTRALAQRFGVLEPCVRNVRKGKTWRHVV